MKAAILQSNYIPWRGYFDLIGYVDKFIIFDDVQFTRRDWRNRNLIKTPAGLQWLTIPVQVKGKYYQTILETKISGNDWKKQHWKALESNYRRSNFFDELSTLLKPFYNQDKSDNLSELNTKIIKSICNYLGIQTIFLNSWNLPQEEGRSEKLARLCQEVGATEYVSGPAAKNYLDTSVFKQSEIKVSWFDYENLPEYRQLWGEFVPNVSIIDLLFNCGPDSRNFLRYSK